jgi:hypothetical protein
VSGTCHDLLQAVACEICQAIDGLWLPEKTEMLQIPNEGNMCPVKRAANVAEVNLSGEVLSRGGATHRRESTIGQITLSEEVIAT